MYQMKLKKIKIWGLIISFDAMLVAFSNAQVDLPLIKIKDLQATFDSILVADSIFVDGVFISTLSEFEKGSIKVGAYLESHPTYSLAWFTKSEDDHFGKRDSIIVRFNEGSVGTVKTKNGTDYYSFNRGIDTLLIGNSLFVEVNPFRHVFGFYKDTLYEEKSIKIITGVPHYSFHSNNKLASATFYNNEYGSVKYYWNENGHLLKKGAFWLNKKNGPWEYYNLQGELELTETYLEGVLKNSE